MGVSFKDVTKRFADGTVAEVRARYAADGAASLEDVFFRATGEAGHAPA